MSAAEQIRAAGIVGCGGAGFPTHVKYGGKAEYLIMNGAECEPLLHTDRYLMRNYAGALVQTLASLAGELCAEHCVIALKREYTDEISALRSAVEGCGAPVRLHLLDSFYPAGDEQTLVYEVAGRVVPPAGIPMDVGCVVSNTATVLAVSDALREIPFTHKYLTVTGEVRSPVVLRVPVGTALEACIALAGGALTGEYCVLLGGPMMGRVLSCEQAREGYVTKTTSGLVVLPADHPLAERAGADLVHMLNRARAACIRCSQCTELCPRHLLGHPIAPHQVMRLLAAGETPESLPLDNPVAQSALLCCECGICELVACPMGLQPRRINALMKKRLAAAGVRYPKGQGQGEVVPERALRKLPTLRAAARAGVLAYRDRPVERFEAADTQQVCLALNQQIGAPCVPVVETGARVDEGALIARCPEGKLGADLHASIGGVVRCVPGAIWISAQKEGMQR